MSEGVVIALAAVGLAFSLSGAVGILRMPDVYSRIQCSRKTITMGALPVLLALVVGEGPFSAYGSRALLVAVLLLVSTRPRPTRSRAPPTRPACRCGPAR